MIARNCRGQAFVVACKASKARCPAKASLHYPAARQQNETALGLGMFYNLQGDAVRLRSLLDFFPRVSLIGEDQLHRLSRRLLHRLCQLAHLRPILIAGRSDMQGQQIAQGIDHRMP